MTTHELGAILLAGPNAPLVCCTEHETIELATAIILRYLAEGLEIITGRMEGEPGKLLDFDDLLRDTGE